MRCARGKSPSTCHSGAAWLPDQPRTFQQRKRANAQEAHEAVRPVSFKMAPKDVERALESKDGHDVWKRNVAAVEALGAVDMERRVRDCLT